MGVRALTSYIEGNKKQFYEERKLKNTKLVIDGNSLLCNFHVKSGLDQRHGGDYESFANIIQQFFDALTTCNIKPFVVMDGAIDYSGKKFPRLKERVQGRIELASKMSSGKARQSQVSPFTLLSRAVFRQKLSSLNVPFIYCMFEADQEVACLANKWNCAVLSKDSDFYIFDLKGGYLPYEFFEWHNISMCQETKERYIPVSHFSINNFCACFNNMNKELLPLFAVIVGNDYTSPRSMDAFFSRVNFSQVAQPAHWWMHARIDGLLHWLSQFPGPEEAMDEVLVRDSAQDITQDIISGMQEYKVSHSNLAQYFMHGASVDNLAKYYTPANLPEPVRHLPEWLLDRLSRGHLPSFILDVLVLQKTILGVQVENCQLPSSHTTSLPIRQVFYGLLLDGNRKLLQGQGSEQGETTNPTEGSPLYHVQEFDRQGLKFQGASIDAILPSGIQQLPLEKLNEVLLETLGADESITIADRPHLNLPVCVTCYWLSSSKPKPNLQMVQALLLGIVYGELCRLGGSQRGPAAEYPGVRAVCNRLGRLRVRANERRGPDLDVAHAYSQWQSCLWISIYLNQLLCCPLPEPECAWLYSGTFVHGAVVEMKWGSTPEDLLMGAPFPAQLYMDIQVAVQRSTKGYGYVFVECMPTVEEHLEVDVVGMEDGVTHNTIIAVAEAEASSQLCHGEEAVLSTGVAVDAMELEDVETYDTSTIAVAEAEASSELCPGEEAVPSTGVAVDAMEFEDVCAADEEMGALGDGEAAHQPESLPQTYPYPTTPQPIPPPNHPPADTSIHPHERQRLAIYLSR
ncbi:protein asteroid homolog 1-like [Conger conger]|uniref:protein asteroid homolog 1-like n=1 Tax=Conger conger TaxID=82655 RepID=UPI002A59D427|nr:protein asteroid homolog 1-like [Conger conger]